MLIPTWEVMAELIHERLKQLLEELNLSQRQFSRKINLDPGYFSRIVQGKVHPPDRILLLIENVFHINKNWLERGEGPIFADDGSSTIKKHLYELISQLTDEQANAVSAFIRYLTEDKQK